MNIFYEGSTITQKCFLFAGPQIKTQLLSYIKDSKTNTHITLNYIKLQIKI